MLSYLAEHRARLVTQDEILEAVWADTHVNPEVVKKNAEPEPGLRMKKLAAAEERLLRAMPVLPLFFDAYSCLQKPYVRDLALTAYDRPQFKYAWIDTNWRPS